MCNEVDEVTRMLQLKIKTLAAWELKIIISVTSNIYVASTEKNVYLSPNPPAPTTTPFLKASLSAH